MQEICTDHSEVVPGLSAKMSLMRLNVVSDEFALKWPHAVVGVFYLWITARDETQLTPDKKPTNTCKMNPSLLDLESDLLAQLDFLLLEVKKT